jgi:hypothetical protein
VIILRSQDCENPAVSFAGALREFEKTLYWVTDRLGLAVSSRYEAGWGNMILLLAWQGKLRLLLDTSKRTGAALAPADALEHHQRVLDFWETYVQDFPDEVAQELEEQFEASILSRLQKVVASPSILSEFHDFRLFLEERDTIELFLDGSDSSWHHLGFRERVTVVDERLKDYVLGKVRNTLLAECPLNALQELNIPWLPSSYWWRHMEWRNRSGGAGGVRGEPLS